MITVLSEGKVPILLANILLVLSMVLLLGTVSGLQANTVDDATFKAGEDYELDRHAEENPEFIVKPVLQAGFALASVFAILAFYLNQWIPSVLIAWAANVFAVALIVGSLVAMISRVRGALR